MSILPIVFFPAPILKKRCTSIDSVNDELRKLLDDMVETMIDADGSGLAAPQVGHSIRVCIVDTASAIEKALGKADQNGIIKMINPEIIEQSGEITWEEGCLSIPFFYQEMTRSNVISVRFLDETGKSQKMRAEGLPAVICQHELDHLNGKLIIDQISRLKQKMYLDRLKKKLEEHKSHAL